MPDEIETKEQKPAVDPKELAALQESIRKLEEKNRELIAEKGEAKSIAQKAAEEAAKKSGDIESLEKSWKEKLDAVIKERDEKLQSYQGTISQMTSGQAASKLANDLAIPGSADGLLPHIVSRLETEITADGAVIRVLDKDGKPSAMSIDDLKKEIMENKALAPLIIGSMANGSGSPGSKGERGGKSMRRSAFDQLNPIDKMKHIKEGGKVVD
jgi:chromosome segregation ATPase